MKADFIAFLVCLIAGILLTQLLFAQNGPPVKEPANAAVTTIVLPHEDFSTDKTELLIPCP